MTLVRAYQPGLISPAQFEAAYSDPVRANLDVLRVAAMAFAMRTSRKHEKLPRAPAFKSDPDTPVSPSEFGRATRTIEKWSTRAGYDPYFCAGEMMAAYCEVLRLTILRAPATPPSVLAELLLAAQAFHYRLIELIDTSNGDHVFSDAHLDELRTAFDRDGVTGPHAPEVETALEEFDEMAGDY